MTKILVNIELLAYQQEMKESLRQVLQHNYIDGIRQQERAEPPLAREHLLLPPPDILCLALDAYQGQGNLIESGEVFPDLKYSELWDD